MEILLLRHGQTAGNRLRRYIGRTDEPLSEDGEARARELTPRGDVERVYVSPMLRARQTAEILFPNAGHIVVPDLREMDFGDFDGRSAADLENDAKYRAWVDGGCLERCPGGERVDEFADRVLRAFDALVFSAAGKGEEKLHIVAHGGTLMAVMYGRAESNRSYFDWFAKNCEGFEATIDASRWGEKHRFTGWREATL